MMKTAYVQFVKLALRKGYTVSVWDGEEWQVKRSPSFNAICEAIKSVEEAQLRVRDAEGKVVAWALVSAFGLEPDETVVDYSVNEFTKEFEDTCY
jgi:hypothetical protein